VPAGWPSEGTRAELVVDLGFIDQQPGFQAEGAAWSHDGVLLKGIAPRNNAVPLPQTSGPVDLYVEAAGNPDVPGNAWTRPTRLGAKETSGSDPLYVLRAVDVALLDECVYELVQDTETLRGLVGVLPVGSPRRAQVLRALERMCDVVDPDDVSGTAAAGRDALAAALAAKATASAHVLHAVGHAHIDSAWLWPVRETKRKVARTVANVLALMDADDEVTFACSSAQQYAWIQDGYPELFERLRTRVKEGRFVPVGGMWVESDTNMVGAEALVRQFVQGKRFFIEQLGVEPTNVWLPDSFGYTGAFPQVARLAGCENFLTQKLSWNDTNRVPHHTFWWEGIDGSQGVHALPARRHLQLRPVGGRARAGLRPVRGEGPGQHLAGPVRVRRRGRRPHPRDGLGRAPRRGPRGVAARGAVRPGGVLRRRPRRVRRPAHLGRRALPRIPPEAELWATTASVREGAAYPYDELERVWRTVLLQQFHDILPGTSIAWVHREAEQRYVEVAAELEGIVTGALGALTGPGDRPLAVNASPFRRGGTPALAAGPVPTSAPARLVARDGGWVLENGAARVLVDAQGLVVSAVHLPTGREVLPTGEVGNLLQLHRDIPNAWEAWDIDEHYRRSVVDLTGADVVEQVPGRAALRIVRTFSASRVEQVLSLADGDDPTLHVETAVDWHEKQKLLKLAFPVDVHTAEARSEIQFGHVTRTTHANTSWDTARFETVAHRWVHVGEPGFGVSVANDGTYGHDITRFRVGDRSGSRVRLSLLRAPLFPDPDADQGAHVFRCAVTFGADVAEAVRQGYALNLPVRTVTGDRAIAPLFAVGSEQVVVEAVKLAEDRSGDVVVRLYEAWGARATTTLGLGFAHGKVVETDLLERTLAAADVTGDEVRLALRPFEVLTLRIARPV